MHLHKPEDLFQRALDLTPGDQLIIPCLNFRHMEAVRQSLYRQKWRLMEFSPATAHKIIISREMDSKKENFQIVLSQLMPVPEAYILYKDGTREVLEPMGEGELERVISMMLKDGHTQEEIETYKRNYFRSVQLMNESEESGEEVTNEQEESGS